MRKRVQRQPQILHAGLVAKDQFDGYVWRILMQNMISPRENNIGVFLGLCLIYG